MRAGQRRSGDRASRSFASLDAVTLDAYGTLVTVRDPVARLAELLRERGVERPPERVRAAFEAEAKYYMGRSLDGRDEATLAALRTDCAQVFLDAVGAEVEAAEFAPHYVAALEFEPLPGVLAAVRRLRARGLALAVVANWDVSVHECLDGVGLTPYVDVVVSSAEEGAAKPDPRIFHRALGVLGVPPERACHVGDRDTDCDGAAAAGMQFVWAPLASAFEDWR